MSNAEIIALQYLLCVPITSGQCQRLSYSMNGNASSPYVLTPKQTVTYYHLVPLLLYKVSVLFQSSYIKDKITMESNV